MGQVVSLVLAGALALALLAGCQSADVFQRSDASQRGAYRVGYVEDPLLAPLFLAGEGSRSWELVRTKSSSDVGYAFIAGEVDAGFVETSRARKLLDSPGGEKLMVAGAIQFPYGATLVVREGLDMRLEDLESARIAVQAQCALVSHFEADALRFGLDLASLDYEQMPFPDMLPALEAGLVDAILVKSAHAALAEQQGHSILYQNWDVEEGKDECCPRAVAQTEYLLLVDSRDANAAYRLAEALLNASTAPAAELRAAAASATGAPVDLLESHPVAVFAPLTDEQRELFGEDRCLTIR